MVPAVPFSLNRELRATLRRCPTTSTGLEDMNRVVIHSDMIVL
jgi:hypothetical protein